MAPCTESSEAERLGADRQADAGWWGQGQGQAEGAQWEKAGGVIQCLEGPVCFQAGSRKKGYKAWHQWLQRHQGLA